MNQEIKKRPNFKVLGVLFLIIGLPILWIILNKTGEHYTRPLPFLGEKELAPNGDTIYHTIDNFRLVNQNGDSVTLATYQNKIILASFFFASCETVCPKMNEFISQHIYREFAKDTSIQFLSFTVDPEHDSATVLLKYADQYLAKFPNWQFLTGNRKRIYDLAATSFLIPGAQGEHQGMFHSSQIVLVDKNLRIRGAFETGGQLDKSAIIDAVRNLKLEYKPNAKHKEKR
ncbi:MAG: SCO family protein [bacterium]|nr:SCO family protein [bacterium]